jgi:hypothetical protein
MMRVILWKPPREDWREKHYRIVWVSIAKLDASWQADGPVYLPPMLGAGGRYRRFEQWLLASNPRQRVKMPEIGWRWRLPWCCDCGHASFGDGRHRTAWLRDHGATALPVLVHAEQAYQIIRELGTAERRTIIRLHQARVWRIQPLAAI